MFERGELCAGPFVAYCRWSPEGSETVERKTRCGGSGGHSDTNALKSGNLTPIVNTHVNYLTKNQDLTKILIKFLPIEKMMLMIFIKIYYLQIFQKI